MYWPPTSNQRIVAASIAPPPGGVGGPSSPDGKPIQRLLGLVRDVRVYTQDLRAALTPVMLALRLTDDGERVTGIRSALSAADAAFSRNSSHLDGCLADIAAYLATQDDLYDKYGDETTWIATEWAAAKADWPARDADERGLPATLDTVIAELHDMVYHCGVLTVAPRVNDHLAKIKIGRPLNFERTFADELPEQEDRRRMLEFLRDHSIAVEGLIDVDLGLIYHASSNIWTRIATYLAILATATLGIGFVALLTYAPTWADLSDWPLQEHDFHIMLGVYAFMLIGAAAHLAIDALKQARGGGNSMLSAVDDWPTWIHVKYATLILSILSLWIGLAGYAFTKPITDRIEWRSAFFVGYSIDSVIDLFLQRFTTFAGAETKAIQKSYAPTVPAQT